MSSFPKDFLWGASTASYQIEGAAHEDGRGPSIWDTFSRTPGKVVNGDTGDVACDHYHRVKEDVALIKNMNVGAYRFSTAWPRIQPIGKGAMNEKGLDFYDNLVDQLLANGITPFTCFYHWDLPQALQDKGGWANRDTAFYYRDYAEIVARRLSDRVKHFVTFNEPNVFTLLGNLDGIHAPGIKDGETTLRAIHHVNLGHGLAIKMLREMSPDLKLGATHSIQPHHPATDKEEDIHACDVATAFWSWAFPDPQSFGTYPEVIRHYFEPIVQDGDMAIIQNDLDYLGLNHYTHSIEKADPSHPFGFGGAPLRPGTKVTGMGWPIDPGAFKETLLDLTERYKLPIYVMENGCGYEEDADENGYVDDHWREDFFRAYLSAMHEAISEGANVKGYFPWSLMDNYEWAEGYIKRFGLVHVDYNTLKRTPKRSYNFFAKVAAENKLT